MKDLILIRHGITTWNQEKRFQGQIDTDLSELGHQQAAKTAVALAQSPRWQPLMNKAQRIYCSDLKRAQQTAAPTLSALALPIELNNGLRERHFGVFEGMTHASLLADHPAEYLSWKNRELGFDFGGKGESLIKFSERVKDCFSAILENCGDDAVVIIVTHGGVLNIAHHLATHAPLDQPLAHAIENCGINHLRWDAGSYSIESWGNIDHLQ